VNEGTAELGTAELGTAELGTVELGIAEMGTAELVAGFVAIIMMWNRRSCSLEVVESQLESKASCSVQVEPSPNTAVL